MERTHSHMRTALDKLVSWTGLALAIVLLAAGGLLTWASTFVHDQVHEQLTAQDITMPSGGALDSLPEADKKALEPFAGEPMDSGPAARAYADHFIQVHMNHGTATLAETLKGYGVDAETLDGWKDPLTYSAAGTVASAIPADNTEAIAAVNEFRSETLFKGNTLRGLLLYGYAFATIGSVAGIAAIVCFVGGVGMLVLVALGFWHANKAKQAELATASPQAP